MKNTIFLKMFFIAMIGIAISFSACKKEETTKDDGNKYYLTKESYFAENETSPDTYTEYTYDSENKLTELTYYDHYRRDKVVLEYDSDNRIVKNTVYLKSGSNFSEKYDYNSKNQIDKITTYTNYWEDLTYDGDGNIIKSEHYDDGKLNYYTTFEYDKNGNTTKDYGYHADGSKYWELTKTYYDSKKNPLSDIPQYQILKRIIFEDDFNIKTYNDIGYKLDGSIKYNDIESYTYEYNDNGYATKKIDDIGDFTTYEYKTVNK